LFALVGILGALVQGGLVGRLAKRFGEARLIVQGAGALCLGVALIPFADNLVLLLVAMIIAAYGFSIISPALNSLISLQVGDDVQGSIMGITRSATTLARVAGPAFAGGIFAMLGKDWPYYAGALVMATVTVMAWRALPRLTDAPSKDVIDTNEP